MLCQLHLQDVGIFWNAMGLAQKVDSKLALHLEVPQLVFHGVEGVLC